MIAVLLAVSLTAQDHVDVKPAIDLTITGAGLLAVVIPEFYADQLAPAHCRICDGPDNTGLPGTGSRGSLNAVDAFFHDAMTGFIFSRGTADVSSSVWVYGVLVPGAVTAAFLATGPYASEGAGWRATLIVAESAAVSAAVVQGLKFTAARKRPFVRYGTGETSGVYDVNKPDSIFSLPSGHTALAASLGFATAMTASLQESPAAPWLWGGAALGIVTTASLRMMAEKHYFTDVAAGALIGAASGTIFPLLHRRGGALSTPLVSVGAQGPAFAVSGVF